MPLTQNRRTLLQRAPLLAALATVPAWVQGQTYPAKPIRFVIPVSAGGGADTLGRTVTERWGRVLNQTFVVDNQAGGGGAIASQNVARAVPDGYTLLMAYVATHGTGRAVTQFAGVGLQIGQKFLQGVDRQAGVDHQHIGGAANHANG